MSWAVEELKQTELGDKRRTERLIRMVEDLSAQPNASVPQASRDGAAMQGMYDFWANPRIAPDDILSGHQKSTYKRIAQHRTVLAIQDTSAATTQFRRVYPMDRVARGTLRAKR